MNEEYAKLVGVDSTKIFILQKGNTVEHMGPFDGTHMSGIEAQSLKITKTSFVFIIWATYIVLIASVEGYEAYPIASYHKEEYCKCS